jgi:hypothetical protein
LEDTSEKFSLTRRSKRSDVGDFSSVQEYRKQTSEVSCRDSTKRRRLLSLLLPQIPAPPVVLIQQPQKSHSYIPVIFQAGRYEIWNWK